MKELSRKIGSLGKRGTFQIAVELEDGYALDIVVVRGKTLVVEVVKGYTLDEILADKVQYADVIAEAQFGADEYEGRDIVEYVVEQRLAGLFYPLIPKTS